VEEVNFIS